MRCFSDVLKKTLTSMFLTMFEKNPKHRINDASNDVNRPPLTEGGRVDEQGVFILCTHTSRMVGERWLGGLYDTYPMPGLMIT